MIRRERAKCFARRAHVAEGDGRRTVRCSDIRHGGEILLERMTELRDVVSDERRARQHEHGGRHDHHADGQLLVDGEIPESAHGQSLNRGRSMATRRS